MEGLELLKKLKNIYGSELVVENSKFDHKRYTYFSYEDKFFGIRNTSLTSRELDLLSLQYQKVSPKYTDINSVLYSEVFLKQNKEYYSQLQNKKLGFYIIKPEAILDNEIFITLVELLSSLSEDNWHTISDEDGYIYIFTNENAVASITYEDLIQTIEAEFMMSIKAVHVEPVLFDANLPIIFMQTKNIFKKIDFNMGSKLIEQKDIFEVKLQEVVTTEPLLQLEKQKLIENCGDELLMQIKYYLDSKFNLLKSAQDLYLHRNTMQKKIKKFIDLSGYNIKEMDEAVRVYLLLNY